MLVDEDTSTEINNKIYRHKKTGPKARFSNIEDKINRSMIQTTQVLVYHRLCSTMEEPLYHLKLQ